MADIRKELKSVEKKIEHGIVEGINKAKEVVSNVARHIPLANLIHDRKNDKYVIEIDLPGVRKEDINVTVEGDYLIVTAERKFQNEVKEDDYYLLESKFGKFYRAFYLSDEIDRDSIEAKFEDGKLIITFEKVPSKKRKDIEVK
ncbi:MAG: Hsp20/alpha crystallin family protein [Epsilonproteobacteria bacterium]|nr:Hsp20/alpha crystallin family protein [Campylobacterota bacterium]